MDPNNPNHNPVVNPGDQPIADNQAAPNTEAPVGVGEVQKLEPFGSNYNANYMPPPKSGMPWKSVAVIAALITLSVGGVVFGARLFQKPTGFQQTSLDPSAVGSNPGSTAVAGQLTVNGSVLVAQGLEVNGDETVGGTVKAGKFAGDGSGLTNINASNCQNCVALQPASPGTAQTGNISITGTVSATNLAGNGAAITSVNAATLGEQNGAFYQDASNLNAGTLSNARLSNAVTLQGNTFNGASQLVLLDNSGRLPAVSGELLTNVNAASLNGQAGSFYQNASNLNAGTISDTRLSANVALLNAANNFSSANNTFVNAALSGNVLLQGISSSIVRSNGSFTTTLAFSDPVADVTVNIPAVATPGSYDVCLTSGNCAASNAAPQDSTYLTLSADANLTDERVVTAGTNIDLNDAGANSTLTIATVDNPTFSTSVTTPLLTSATALAITTGGALTVGTTSQQFTLRGDGTSTITATNAGSTTTIDFASPTANTTLRVPALSAGTYEICTSQGNCSGSGVTLQSAYNNSTSPEFTLDATRGGLTIRDASSPLGTNLLEVQSNDGLTTYFAVTTSGISTTGIAASGAVSGSSFTGSGSGLTSLNASNISSGTLNDSRLSSNVALLNAMQSFTAANSFASTVAIQGPLTVGTSSSTTGSIIFKGSGGVNSITVNGQNNPASNRTITLPDASGTVAVSASGNIALSGAGNITFTGTLPVANGGTGSSTVASDGQLLIGNSSGFTLSTLTAGTGVSISNASGSITISVPSVNQCSTCANNALSNLASVSINTSLIPQASVDLGSGTAPFRDLYLYGGAGSQATNFKITGTSTSGTRTLTLPDASGTVCISTNNCNYVNLQASTPGSMQTGNINVDGTIIAGTAVQSASILTADKSASSTNSSTITLRSGNATGSNSLSGDVVIKSGDGNGVTGTSGNITIDVGTGNTKGTLTIAGSNASALTLGRSGLDTSLPGTLNGQTITSAAVFTGTVAIQGANALTLGTASSTTGSIILQNSSGANTVTLKSSNTNPASSFTITLPSALPGSTDCLNLSSTGQIGTQSCSSGLGGSGTQNTITKFGVGGTSVSDSSITDDGSTVTVVGTSNSLVIQGGVTIGKNGASGNRGTLTFNDGTNPGRVYAIQPQQSGNGLTIQLPTDADVGSTCLVLNSVSAGVAKIAGGSCNPGGSGGNVNASGDITGRLLRTTNSTTHDVTASLVQDNGTSIGVNVAPGASLFTVGSEADFFVSDGGALTADGLDLSGSGSNSSITNALNITATGLIQTSASGQALSLSGAPTNSATQSLLSLGNAIVSGNSVANGGTYIGLNAPNSGAGSAADFINFQKNGTSFLKVTNAGNITAGTYNGLTLTANATGFSVAGGTASRTLTVTSNATIDQNLSTSSNVTHNSLSLSTALGVASGGTGLTSTPTNGQLLIGNGTNYTLSTLTAGTGVTINNASGSITINAPNAGSCSSCATTSLSNLSSVSINSSLLAQTGVDLGSSTAPFRDLYIYGGSLTPGTNNFKLTGTPTAARTLTLSDLTGTIALVQSAGSSTAQTGDINATGTVIAGTALQAPLHATANTSSTSTNSAGITLRSGNATGLTSNSGSVTIDAGTATGTAGAITIGGSNASSTTVGRSGATLSLAGNSSSTFAATSGGNTSTLGFATPTANTNYNLPALAAGTYTLCTSSGNCAGVGATLQTSYDNGNSILATNGRNIQITLQDLATDQTFEITQAGTADAFRVNDDGTFSDTTAFVIDANGNVGIGDSTPTALLTVAGDAFKINSSGAITAAAGITSSGTINFSSLTASRALFTDGSSNLATTGASAALASSLSDETGSGVVVFGTSPTITTSLNTGSASFDLLNTTVGTINFGSAASTVNIGATSGTTTVNNNLAVASGKNFSQTGAGTFSTGTGGSTFNGNTSISGSNTFTVGTGLTSLGGGLSVTAGAATLSGGLTVTGAGSFVVQKGVDFSTTGASTAASFTGSLIRLTGASAQTIQGITGTSDGRVITLINAASQNATIANQNAGAAATERIITGTGADIILVPDASLTLVYDATTSRWRVRDGIGGTGVTTVGAIGSSPNANGASISGNTLTLQPADASNGGVVNTGTQTFAGNKTFANLTTFQSQLLISGVATDITTGTNEDFTVVANGSGIINLNDSVTVGSGLTVSAGGASIAGNTTIATTAGTLGLGNAGGALTLTGNSSSTFVINGSTVDASEFNLLDGRNAALVDINDAVNTAITGTGALSAGSIASGFGSISTASTISTSSNISTTGSGTITSAGLLTASAGLTISSGTVSQTYSSSSATSAHSIGITNTNTGAGVTMQGINLTPTNTSTASSGTNQLNVLNFAVGGALGGTDVTNGINFAGATGYTNYISSPTAVLSSGGAWSGLTGVSSSGTITFSGLSTSSAVFVNGGGNLSTSGTSAFIATSLSDETGTGHVVFDSSPTITSPSITTSLTTSSGTFSLINTNALTVSFAGAANVLSIGSSSGTTTINNALTVSGVTNLNNGLSVVGTISQSYSSASASSGQSLAFTNTNTGAGVAIQGINMTPTNTATPSSGTNVLNLLNFAAGTALGASDQTNGINFASATGYTNYLKTPTAALSSGGAWSGLTGLTSSGTITLSGLASCDTIDTNASGVLSCGSDAGGSLQATYDNDVNGSDVSIALSTADGSLIFSNPSTGGTTSGYVLAVTQSATGAVDGIRITNAGTGVLASLDNSNASGNGVAIDVQSSSASQYALRVTSNNGATNALNVGGDGRVGVGTTTPNAKLHISTTSLGDTYTDIQGNSARAGAINIDQTVSGVYPDTTVFRTAQITTNVNLSADPIARFTGFVSQTGSSSSATTNIPNSSFTALNGVAYNGANINVANLIASDLFVVNNGTGNINTSAIGNQISIKNGGGTIAEAKGINIKVDTTSTGTFTNTYGIYIDDVTSGTQTNQAYGIYQVDTNARNYLGGKLGIATSTPSGDLTFGENGTTARTINVLQRTVTGAGTPLTISAGDGFTSGASQNGSNLTLQAGAAASGTGTSAGGSVILNATACGGSGCTNNGSIQFKVNNSTYASVTAASDATGITVPGSGTAFAYFGTFNCGLSGSNSCLIQPGAEIAIVSGGGASTSSGRSVFMSNNASGTSHNSGDVIVASGNAAGTTSNSGDVILQTGTATSTRGDVLLQPSGGNVGVGTNTPTRRLDVTGDWGGNTSVTSAQGTAGTTTVTATALAYHLTANGNGTTCGNRIFNITGLSNTEGSFAYIYTDVNKVACSGTASIQVNINGTYLSSTTYASCCGSNTESYIAMYINGSWRVVAVNTQDIQSGDTLDLAEWIPYSGDQPQAGDILTVGDDPESVQKSSSAYDSKLIGVVTTAPNKVMGIAGDNKTPLALSGRVPVKVSTENGPINAGDPITSSSLAGVGMKATAYGRVIGKALTGYSGAGIGSVIVLVGNDTYTPPPGTLVQGVSNFESVTVTGNASVGSLNVSGMATINSLTVVDNISTQRITVTDKATIQTIIVLGHIIGNPDTRGEVTIIAGQTQVHHNFATSYNTRPFLVASPISKAVTYRVETDETGFTIYLDQAESQNIRFNYLVQE